MMRGPLPVAAAFLAACVHYAPAPVDPARQASDFAARSLSDPGLRAWLGQEPSPGDAWDLSTLTRVALYYHPDLDLARAELHAAQAGVVTAGARPNPTLFLGAEYAAFNATPGSPWTNGINFDLPIETAGKRGRRIEQATHRSEAARLGLATTGWRVRSRLRSALLDHLVAERGLVLARDEASSRGEAVRLLQRRLEAGEGSRPELARAQLDLATATLAARQAEGRVLETLAALAAALGLGADALDGAELAWPPLDAPPPVAALPPGPVQRAALLDRSELRAALAEYDAAESAFALEVAKQYPDLHLGPGYLFDQGQNKFQLGLAIELPILDRHQGPIAEAVAAREAAGARLLAAQAGILEELDSALAHYRATRASLDEADGILKLTEQQERQTERAFSLGASDRLDLASVRVERSVAARARLEALAQAESALGALEDAVERPLDAGLAAPEVPVTSPRVESARSAP